MLHCANCGAPLAHDAQFCPRCGHAVAKPPSRFPAAQPAAPPPVTPATPPVAPTEVVHARPGRVPWWIVPLVIVGIVVIAWLLMAGLPFGGDETPRVAERPAAETIGEGSPPPASPPASSGTIVDVDADTAEEPPPVTITQTTAPPPPVTTTTAAPPPVIVDQTPAPIVPPREISEEQAAAVLRGYVTSRRYYDVGPECVQIRGSGYRNVGYGFSVWTSCGTGGGSRMLGRWRVDAKTREVFVQGDDGRYLRP
jgi:hypothetical protein